MNYSRSAHTTYHNRYHLVWITKYRYKVLKKDIKIGVRELTRNICKTLGVKIISGVLSSNQVHMFVEGYISNIRGFVYNNTKASLI